MTVYFLVREFVYDSTEIIGAEVMSIIYSTSTTIDSPKFILIIIIFLYFNLRKSYVIV